MFENLKRSLLAMGYPVEVIEHAIAYESALQDSIKKMHPNSESFFRLVHEVFMEYFSAPILQMAAQGIDTPLPYCTMFGIAEILIKEGTYERFLGDEPILIVIKETFSEENIDLIADRSKELYLGYKESLDLTF